MATSLEDKRQELMDSAPEGVDYVYVEMSENSYAPRVWMHGLSGWNMITCNYEDIDLIWNPSFFDKWYPNEELPRRWGNMSIQLEDWIESLGLRSEYESALYDKFEFDPEDIYIRFSPQQQEERPKFALEFLKSKLKLEKKLETLSLEERLEKYKGVNEEEAAKFEEKYANDDRLVSLTRLGDALMEGFNEHVEPVCTCANVSWGHEVGCQWKEWKDQHGT